MFRACLFNDLSREDVGNLERFIKVYTNTLNNHASSNKSCTKGNHLLFMNKELSKAVMNRTMLRKVYFKKKSLENGNKYSKQWIYCVSSYTQQKKCFLHWWRIETYLHLQLTKLLLLSRDMNYPRKNLIYLKQVYTF